MGYRFLIVDDTQFMRKMAADSLKQYGYEVAGEALNGKQAIKLYQELKPDIVMIDLTMPEMNGVDAIKEILRIDSAAVILVCSASNQKDFIEDALKAGAKGYLTKPFQPERMEEVIRKYAIPLIPQKPQASETEDAKTEVLPEQPQKDQGLSVESEPAEESLTSEVQAAAAVTEGVLEELPLSKPTITAIPEAKESAPLPKPRSVGLKSFVTRYMCSWQEEIDGAAASYTVSCSDQEQDIVIEWNGNGGTERQSVKLSIDGFRQLAEWLEQQPVLRKAT